MNPQDKLAEINSATKYPSIPTYHAMGDRGRLKEDEAVACDDQLYLSEKVDGTNGRIIIYNDHVFIGSREELLTHVGDWIANPADQIVEALMPLVPKVRAHYMGLGITTFYFEVYGGRLTRSHNYTSTKALSARLLDISYSGRPILHMSCSEIASWRQHGGQEWLSVGAMRSKCYTMGIDMVPQLGTIEASDMPCTFEGCWEFLESWLPSTRCAIDAGAHMVPEGIVARTADRQTIFKMRCTDYARSMMKTQTN